MSACCGFASEGISTLPLTMQCSGIEYMAILPCMEGGGGPMLYIAPGGGPGEERRNVSYSKAYYIDNYLQ